AAEHEEEVGLILPGVARRPEGGGTGRRIDGDPRVVAGGQAGRPELTGPPPEQSELHVLVAARTWIWGPAGEILRHERLHDVALERLRHVEDVVREAEPIGDGARVVEVVERAAMAVRLAEEAERDADHVVSRGDAAGGRDGAVHAAAHGGD